MYQFKIYKEIELVSVKLSGEVDFSELIELNLHIYGHPDFLSHFNGLCDERNATVKINQQQMQTIHNATKELGGFSGKWAHLSDTPRNIALVEIYRELSKEWHPVEVCYNLKAAEEFLGYENLKPYLFPSLPR